MSQDNSTVVMKNVSKAFSGVTVLHDGSLTVEFGEVHALMGANGAGKSTLMKILTGVYAKDGGSIKLRGEDGKLAPVDFETPRQAQQAGIGIVHQELILVDSMTIADNIALGREPRQAAGGLVDRRRVHKFAIAALEQVGLQLDPSLLVEAISPAEKQLVEIARALAYQSRILILDEPTTSLSAAEATNLLTVLRRLRDSGLSIVYISHRMDEIFDLADRITVMRDGKFVTTMVTSETDHQSLIRTMIGRQLAVYERELIDDAIATSEEVVVENARKAPLLSVDGLTNKAVDDICFDVHAGEIVGLFGLVGAGRTELTQALFGLDPYDAGSVTINGNPLPPLRPDLAGRYGLALVPEDRKKCGLVLDLPLIRNMELAALKKVSVFREGQKFGRALWRQYREALGIVARGPDQVTRTLSGGNQQKVVLAKWLATSPQVLILDEPTRGIDVAAKQDIYELIRGLAAGGMAVLVVSSEADEIRMLSDRVLVLQEGSLTHDGPNADLDDEALLTYAMGEKR